MLKLGKNWKFEKNWKFGKNLEIRKKKLETSGKIWILGRK